MAHFHMRRNNWRTICSRSSPVHFQELSHLRIGAFQLDRRANNSGRAKARQIRNQALVDLPGESLWSSVEGDAANCRETVLVARKPISNR